MKGRISNIAFPKGFLIETLKPRLTIMKNSSLIIRRAVNKVSFKGLDDKRRVLIVAPDNTRYSHLREIVEELLRLKIFRGKRIFVLFANGLHKEMNDAQMKELVGKKLFSKVKCLNHSLKPGSLKKLGLTKKGIPVELNKKLFTDSFIISIGTVEPHLYAGFSGGAKTVAIGLSGKEGINRTHHPRFLDNPDVGLGIVKGNPFNETLWDIARNVEFSLAINILNDIEGNLLYCFAGKLDKVYERAVREANRYFSFMVKEKADVVICGMGDNKGKNAYQASRAFNYVVNTKRPVVKKKGLVLAVASLEDGFGEGIGEKRFEEVMRVMRDPDKFVRMVKVKGCVAGEHRAYMVAKALKFAALGFITKKTRKTKKSDIFNNMPFLVFRNFEDVFGYIKKEISENPRVLIVPNIFSAIVNVK